jgi:hypothetical protein
MTNTTFFPNLRIARDLKITTHKKKVVGGYKESFCYGVSFDGRDLGNVSQDLACTGIDTTISEADTKLLIDALIAKGAFAERVAEFGQFDIYLFAGPMIGELIREEESLEKMKRRAKNHTLWVLYNSKPNEYFELKSVFSEDVKQAVKMANPAQTIAYFINEDIADL